MAIYVTGDTHGEKGRFWYTDTPFEQKAEKGDYLIICGDFGYIFSDSVEERKLRDIFLEKPYTTCFVDGNHENFGVLNSFPVEEWNGGKVHVIKRDQDGTPKVIHLMRGQVFNIEGKKFFTFGGGYSMDKAFRRKGYSWWPQEMPNNAEYNEGRKNLEKNNNEVDYIISHTVPTGILHYFNKGNSGKSNIYEMPLNNYLEDIRKNVKYKHWYFGHMHEEKELWPDFTALWFRVVNVATNEEVE